MLVHICCSVDSHYFFSELIKKLNNEDRANLKAFFYNPNIHPKEEYDLRLMDVIQSCKKFNIPLIIGQYDVKDYLNKTKYLNKEKEGAKRCDVCFNIRFEESAKKAKELNLESFTTTLLVSPKKDIYKLRLSGEKIAKMFHVKFKSFDFKDKDFSLKQKTLANKNNLYKQNYCGCIYSMINEYENKQELYCDTLNRILPNDIRDRTNIYKLRDKFEEKGIKYKLIKQNILNYRLLNAYLSYQKKVIYSYILNGSESIKKDTKFKINFIDNGIAYTNRYNILLITIKKVNEILNNNFKDIKDMMLNPLSIKDENNIRYEINNIANNNAIFIVDKFEKENYKAYIKATFFNDTITIIKKEGKLC